MEEKWIDDIRTKMADFRAPLPDSVLEEAKREAGRRSGKVTSGKRKTPVIPMWSKVAAAAMVAAVCCMSLWLFLDKEPAKAPLATNRTAGELAEEPSFTIPAEEETPTEKRVKEVYPPKSMSPQTAEALLAQALPVEVASLEPTPEEREETSDTPATRPHHEKNARGTSPVEPRAYTRKGGIPQRSGREPIAFSGYMSGGFGNSGSNVYGSPLSQSFSASSYEPDDRLPMAYATNKSELLSTTESTTHTNHHQPIKAGISLRVPISRHWSVSTGITYSYLGSDISKESGNTKMETKQKLHYVGIPVNANYSVLRTNRLHLYASAGMEVEKLVSGRQDTEHYEGNTMTATSGESVKEGRPQFSGNVAIGAEYRIVNQLSIYAEPGLAYHFDNGSDVENIYKDKPLNLNVQVGLRWELK